VFLKVTGEEWLAEDDETDYVVNRKFRVQS
jgi:hypothetical protein